MVKTRRWNDEHKAPDDREDILRVVLDAGPTLISYVDANYRYQFVNKTLEYWLGQPAEEIEGRRLWEVLGEDAWQAIQPYVKRALRGEVVSYEQSVSMRESPARWVRATYTPDIDEAGKIRGFAAHAVDIREYKDAEENLLNEKIFSESAINSMPGIFYLFDKNGKFLRWNRNLEEASGYSAKEISAMNPLDFFGSEEKSIIDHAISKAFLEGQVRVEANFLSKNGRLIPFYFTGHRMFVDKTPYLIGSGIDLSGRKEAEETQIATLNILEDYDAEQTKLKQLQTATMNLLEDFDEERENLRWVQKAMLNLLEDMHDEQERLNQTQRALLNMLEDIDVERTRAEQAKSQLESVNKELEAFSYSVSHDLRAPLRAVSGFAQAVVEDYSPRLDDEGRRYLGLIQDNAHKMGQLIDDLLAFSRLGRQHMQETQIDMETLVKAVFVDLAALAPDRKIKLLINPAPPAFGDNAMIRQVLMNLVSNAIKFTRNRQEAFIEFGFTLNSGQGAYYLKDNGVGFDMRYMDKLFGVFQRLHSVTEFEGNGVGLALVQRIITRHGGRVWAEGAVDEGATFYFTLPWREIV